MFIIDNCVFPMLHAVTAELLGMTEHHYDDIRRSQVKLAVTQGPGAGSDIRIASTIIDWLMHTPPDSTAGLR